MLYWKFYTGGERMEVLTAERLDWSSILLWTFLMNFCWICSFLVQHLSVFILDLWNSSLTMIELKMTNLMWNPLTLTLFSEKSGLECSGTFCEVNAQIKARKWFWMNTRWGDPCAFTHSFIFHLSLCHYKGWFRSSAPSLLAERSLVPLCFMLPVISHSSRGD